MLGATVGAGEEVVLAPTRIEDRRHCLVCKELGGSSQGLQEMLMHQSEQEGGAACPTRPRARA